MLSSGAVENCEESPGINIENKHVSVTGHDVENCEKSQRIYFENER